MRATLALCLAITLCCLAQLTALADGLVKEAMIWPVLQCTCNDNGVHGNVIITYADGAKTPVTSGGMCAQVRISPDGRTVGWLTGVHRDLWKDGEISFVPTALVLWRDGKLFRHIPGTNGDIIGWQFWNGGAQVALARCEVGWVKERE